MVVVCSGTAVIVSTTAVCATAVGKYPAPIKQEHQSNYRKSDAAKQKDFPVGFRIESLFSVNEPKLLGRVDICVIITNGASLQLLIT